MYIIKDGTLCNFADDNTIWITGTNIQAITAELEADTKTLNNWFINNSMILNGDKCEFTIFESKPSSSKPAEIKINQCQIKEVKNVKLLGITIDSQLKFDNHIKRICREAGKKINALARITPYLSKPKSKLLMQTFIMSYFNYCPLTWMFCSRKSNNLINRIHQRALRIAHNDYLSSFEQLLQKDNSTTIHIKNLQRLAFEIYKTKNQTNPSFMSEIFQISKTPAYDFRETIFNRKKPNTVIYGLDTISYRCSEIWNSIPTEVQNYKSENMFKSKIKQITSFNCSCRICRPYLNKIGYLK